MNIIQIHPLITFALGYAAIFIGVKLAYMFFLWAIGSSEEDEY